MPDILTPEEVAECRERAERATDGPWEAKCSWHDYSYIVNSKGPLGCGTDFGKMPDASFIAHARTDIPALCATVEALREEQKELGDAFTRLVDIYEEGGETEFRPEWVRKALRARELSR